ncbi:hypothetical protein B9N39_12265, partial [Escherichia coli]
VSYRRWSIESAEMNKIQEVSKVKKASTSGHYKQQEAAKIFLHSVDRRQRQMCIGERVGSVRCV